MKIVHFKIKKAPPLTCFAKFALKGYIGKSLKSVLKVFYILAENPPRLRYFS